MQYSRFEQPLLTLPHLLQWTFPNTSLASDWQLAQPQFCHRDSYQSSQDVSGSFVPAAVATATK